jgi:hypothetical protein
MSILLHKATKNEGFVQQKKHYSFPLPIKKLTIIASAILSILIQLILQ